ncbi:MULTISPECIES: ankyrin repeat domain-containing protein [unclassified Streptomyces]|uniref:ankyrin repeat domain-containing protein n=1 Tax=unclassified Streptomyces TaxID=2593676 RepID=UPI0029A81A44|nr:ankyrin repeat domain-containing protein [Streptomyces sp. PA03-2a]MDX2731681.1 ankyrin repeat domain-containing protein [Streptomyces sp. PA03-2a]
MIFDGESSWTPAHHAVEMEDVETLARLLDAGVDPNETDCGMTLLTHAIDVEGDGAMQSGEPLTVHATAVVLAFGADPERPGTDGRTPMSVAEQYGHELAARLLRRHLDQKVQGA